MQFLPRSRSRTSPLNRGVRGIARAFIPQRSHGRAWLRPVDGSPNIVVARDATRCRLSQPTAMLGCVMQCELLHNAPRFCEGKGFRERRGCVGVEIVQHDPALLHLRIPYIDQPAHVLRQILHGPLCGDDNRPPADSAGACHCSSPHIQRGRHGGRAQPVCSCE